MKKYFLAACSLLLVAAAFASECILDKPIPNRLVNNFSRELPDFLSESQTQMLESKLVDFSNQTSNQIVIVIVDDLCGYDANSFATKLGQKWKVGQEGMNNGIVIAIKPTGRSGQRDAYIAIGRGLEAVIPDITANRITDNELIPAFKSGDYYGGLDRATDILMGLAKGEFNSQDYGGGQPFSGWIFLILLVFIILLFIFFAKKSKGYTVSRGGRTYYGGGWGSWGGGGWGSSGGGGGGGFGGFGGGSFGGGGAGGKW